MHKSLCLLRAASFADEWPHSCAGRIRTHKDLAKRQPFYLDGMVHINHYFTFSLQERAQGSKANPIGRGRMSRPRPFMPS